MDIKFRCKSCGQKHGLSEELAIEMAGQTIDCSRCGTPMLIPPVFAIPQDMTSTVTVTKTISRSMPVADILSFTDKLEHGKHHADRTKVPAKDTPTIFFKCKSCGLKYRLGAEYAGMIAQCSHCHTEMNIPLASEQDSGADYSPTPAKPTPSPQELLHQSVMSKSPVKKPDVPSAATPPVATPPSATPPSATPPTATPGKLIQHSPAGLLNKKITQPATAPKPGLPSLKPLSPQAPASSPSVLKPLSPQMLPPRPASPPVTPRLSSLPPQVLSPLRKPAVAPVSPSPTTGLPPVVQPVVNAKPDTPSDDDMPKLTFNKKN